MTLVINNFNKSISSLVKLKLLKRGVGLKTRFFIPRFLSSTSHRFNVDKWKDYDIVVAGGGMVGFAMACALGRSRVLSDKKILLLESSSQKSWSLPENYSNRVCALNESNRQLLTDLGAWKHAANLRVQPVRRMLVWESCTDASLSLANDDPDVNVAHIVENDVILHSLKEEVPPSVEIKYDAKVVEYRLPTSIENTVGIILDQNEKIATRLLIGADGANSLVRETMNMKYISRGYDQMGIVATLKLSEAINNNTAWQKFLPTGPVAILPLSSNYSSLVWSTNIDNAKLLLSLSDEGFIDALNRAIYEHNDAEQRVIDLHNKYLNVLNMVFPRDNQSIQQLPPSLDSILPNSRAAFPLGLGHAVHYVSPRVALIGDAAHRLHPLAGQGVNLGFGDVRSLLNVIEATNTVGLNIGDDTKALYVYESERQKHCAATIGMTDMLYNLYTNNSPGVVLARSIGLSTVDASKKIKRTLMAQVEG